ncbi:hypothetical protein TNCV_3485641 [Trichonephila clavipes]|nr:hypothetical protein TNCV_3485641 [Trichonephila clavipes]
MRGRIIGKIEEGRKITDVARGSTSLTALFHGCGNHLKLLRKIVVDGTEAVLEVRRLQIRQIYRPYISKKEYGRTTARRVANQFLAASGKQISRKTVARRV